MIKKQTTRRIFLKNTALTATGFWIAGNMGCANLHTPRYRSANEKLNIACIGVGGRGSSNVNSVSSENLVAFCDVDDNQAKGVYDKYPKVPRFYDYRKMLDKMHKQIDAVVISTPDHMHAHPAVMAMKYGKHVYCEKPLTHDVYEARILAETAAKYKVATQMGNQGSASDGLRQGVEAIQSGVIGKVREAHVWTNRPVWPQGLARPKEVQPVPDHLKWDLWLGTAPKRDYNKIYLPFNWRGWWDFGTGALGDMGCHTANMAFRALKLESPVSAEAVNSEFHHDSFPTWSVITLQFPARGDMPPLKWVWYDGASDKPEWVIKKLKGLIHGQELSGSGSLLIGDKGALYSPNDYGEKWMLLPKEKFEGYVQPEQKAPHSPGHHKEWILACKDGPKSMSEFSSASPLTETLLLGNVAMYTGKKIEWDGKNCRVTNCEEANALIRRNYRDGYDF